MNSNIKDVTVSKKSKAYARDGQCIYKKSDKSLTIAISNKKGEVRISERVEKLTPDISLVNCAGLKEDPTEGILKRVVFPSKLKHVIVPAFDAFEADEVYFTGSVPPKVTWSKSADEDADALPSGSQVYVPKASAKAYKKWYKKHKCFEYLERRDLFHTYNPGAAF